MEPDKVLTTASSIVCTHAAPPVVPPPPVPPPPLGGGGAVQVPGVSALQVNGNPVLPAVPAVPATVIITGACSVPLSPSTSPCTTPPGPAVITGGAAAKLRVNNVPVLLAGSFTALTPLGKPPAAFQVDAGQQKLRAT